MKKADAGRRQGPVRLAPDAFLERFGDSGVILLADRDRWMRVNGAAADLFEEAGREFGRGAFGLPALASLLLRRYRLDPRGASRRAAALVRQWLRLGILLPAGDGP